MASPPKRYLSLDTNVLLELVNKGETAIDFRQTFQAKGYALVIPPRVVIELHLIEASKRPQDARLAAIALRNLRTWAITTFDLPEIMKAIL